MVNNYKTASTRLGLGLTMAVGLSACISIPKPMTLQEVNNMDKEQTVSQGVSLYVDRKAAFLAAKTDREATCIHELGLEGKIYDTPAAFFKENDNCVTDLRNLHVVGYTLLGVGIDLTKGYMLNKLSNSGSSTPTDVVPDSICTPGASVSTTLVVIAVGALSGNNGNMTPTDGNTPSSFNGTSGVCKK
ncbi:MAG: hypothetical protein HRU03_01235 [Nanoarchaeales archaeon]|nr:hypothetical protein [Nanoarchaeales archaeon]